MNGMGLRRSMPAVPMVVLALAGMLTGLGLPSDVANAQAPAAPVPAVPAPAAPVPAVPSPAAPVPTPPPPGAGSVAPPVPQRLASLAEGRRRLLSACLAQTGAAGPSADCACVAEALTTADLTLTELTFVVLLSEGQDQAQPFRQHLSDDHQLRVMQAAVGALEAMRQRCVVP